MDARELRQFTERGVKESVEKYLAAHPKPISSQIGEELAELIWPTVVDLIDAGIEGFWQGLLDSGLASVTVREPIGFPLPSSVRERPAL